MEDKKSLKKYVYVEIENSKQETVKTEYFENIVDAYHYAGKFTFEICNKLDKNNPEITSYTVYIGLFHNGKRILPVLNIHKLYRPPARRWAGTTR